jgi:hypothetical protein
MTPEGLIWLVVYALILCIVAGGLTWLVRSAPFIPEPFKSYICWGIWAILVLVLLLWLVRQAGNARLW